VRIMIHLGRKQRGQVTSFSPIDLCFERERERRLNFFPDWERPTFWWSLYNDSQLSGGAHFPLSHLDMIETDPVAACQYSCSTDVCKWLSAAPWMVAMKSIGLVLEASRIIDDQHITRRYSMLSLQDNLTAR
jgi:hypothetical protein